MSKPQRIILAIGLAFIVALGLWPPFQYRGQYEGQHFLFNPAYGFGRIDTIRLGIGWLSIVLVFAIILLLNKTISLKALKILGVTIASLVLITVGVVLVVKENRESARRQAYSDLVQKIRNDLTAVTMTNAPEMGCVVSNPTKWVLSGAVTVNYLTPERGILFSENSTASLRHYGQDTPGFRENSLHVDITSLRFLSDWQKNRLSPKKPFTQEIIVKYNRATSDDQQAELDPPFEVAAARYFVFYPAEWGWDELSQTSYLRGPEEFKQVSSSTQAAPVRRLAAPPPSYGQFKLSDIEQDPEALLDSFRKKLDKTGALSRNTKH